MFALFSTPSVLGVADRSKMLVNFHLTGAVFFHCMEGNTAKFIPKNGPISRLL